MLPNFVQTYMANTKTFNDENPIIARILKMYAKRSRLLQIDTFIMETNPSSIGVFESNKYPTQSCLVQYDCSIHEPTADRTVTFSLNMIKDTKIDFHVALWICLLIVYRERAISENPKEFVASFDKCRLDVIGPSSHNNSRTEELTIFDKKRFDTFTPIQQLCAFAAFRDGTVRHDIKITEKVLTSIKLFFSYRLLDMSVFGINLCICTECGAALDATLIGETISSPKLLLFFRNSEDNHDFVICPKCLVPLPKQLYVDAIRNVLASFQINLCKGDNKK